MKRELAMAKIDLDSLSIEEVANLRDLATDKLAEKVAARRAELEAELEVLAQYDKPARKSQVAAPAAKPKKSQETGAGGEAGKKSDEAREPVAKAA
jgi:hypothetical protein